MVKRRMLLLALLTACTAPSPEPSPDAPACPDDSLAAGEVDSIATGFTVDGTIGTEGLVFSPDGRLFVGGAAYTGGGYVAEILTDGTWSMLADVPGSVGLEWFQDQVVVAVSGGGMAGEEGGLVLVDPDSGDTSVLAMGIPGSNFPVATPWDTLLVSAPGGTTIWEVDAQGTVTQWATGLVSPNGLVFDHAGEWLYVAQTYESPNVVRRVAVNSDGTAGAMEVVAELGDGSTQDGVAIDDNGDVYVVLNLPGEVVRVTPDGDVTLVADGVDYGASMHFGTGEFDDCSLYATSLFGEQIFQIGVGVPGL